MFMNMELRKLVFCVCLMITIKVIVITGGMALTPHSQHLIIKRPVPSLRLPVWSFRNCSPARPSSHLTSLGPHTKCFLS